jgi:hypothetical protein
MQMSTCLPALTCCWLFHSHHTLADTPAVLLSTVRDKHAQSSQSIHSLYLKCEAEPPIVLVPNAPRQLNVYEWWQVGDTFICSETTTVDEPSGGRTVYRNKRLSKDGHQKVLLTRELNKRISHQGHLDDPDAAVSGGSPWSWGLFTFKDRPLMMLSDAMSNPQGNRIITSVLRRIIRRAG